MPWNVYDNLFAQKKLNETNHVKKNGLDDDGYSYSIGIFLSKRKDINQIFVYL